MPGLVNAHIHLLDSIVQDACIGYSISGYAGSRGVKHALTRLYGREATAYKGFIRDHLSMYSSIGDFLENPQYCSELRQLFSEYNVLYKPLSRPINTLDPDEYSWVAKTCGGVGVANPTNIPPYILDTLARISRDYIVAAHVSETPWMQRVGGLEYLVEHGVRLRHVVHGVYLEDWEYRYLVDNDIVLVVCPRSNLWFQGRLPRLGKAYNYGVGIAIGTDNTGCFHPNIWSDIEIAYSIVHSRNPSVKPREFLKHIIKSSIKALALEKPWYIVENEKADILALNGREIMVHRSYDKIGAIIKRAWVSRNFIKITDQVIKKL